MLSFVSSEEWLYFRSDQGNVPASTHGHAARLQLREAQVQLAGDKAVYIFLDCWLEERVSLDCWLEGRVWLNGSWECGNQDQVRKIYVK